jgi:hypothetical protein
MGEAMMVETKTTKKVTDAPTKASRKPIHPRVLVVPAGGHIARSPTMSCALIVSSAGFQPMLPKRLAAP